MSHYLSCVGCETLCNTIIVHDDQSIDVGCIACYESTRDNPYYKESYLLSMRKIINKKGSKDEMKDENKKDEMKDENVKIELRTREEYEKFTVPMLKDELKRIGCYRNVPRKKKELIDKILIQ